MLKVVIVDDEPLILMNLSEVLAEAGYEVVGTASNGFSAIEVCMEKKPDILIADIRMPDLDGLQVAKYVHDGGFVETIVIVSAFDDDEFVVKAGNYGVSAFVVKPIDTKTLLSTIKVATIRSKELVELKNEIYRVNKNMESRKKIEKAKGLIMKKMQTDESSAFNYIREISRNNNMSMNLVAEILLNGENSKEQS